MEIWQKLLEGRKSGRAAVLATVVEASGSAPRAAGAKMIYWEDGKTEGTIGGGAVERIVCERCPQVLQDRRPVLLDYELGSLGMICGGRMKIYLEPYFAQPPLILFGGGHIAKALAPIAVSIGFRVTVVDDRPETASAERFPEADRVLALPYEEALNALDFNEETYIVIATHRHQHDRAVLEECLKKPFAYLGMIGSRTKAAETRRALQEIGFAEELLRRVHSPIGLSIGAETPEEIAVSIAAELIAAKSGSDCRSLSMTVFDD